jgi:probable rRNA maturation factor
LAEVEFVLTETKQSVALDRETAAFCERAVHETLLLEGRRLAGMTGQPIVPPSVEVSLTLLDDPGITALNHRYLGRDEATDVLAFPMDSAPAAAGEAPARGSSEPFLLGDIVVSIQTAASGAAEYGRPFPEELARLVAHGTLHLLGYTDESPEAAASMHAKEDAVLVALGFSPRVT